MIKWDWWDEFSHDLEMYYPKLAAMALRGYVAGLRGVSITQQIQIPVVGTIIWCIDLCSGFQSRRDPCMALLREHSGTGTCRYVAIDVAPLLVAGDKTFVPDWCVDLLDFQKLPLGKLVQSIALYFGLSMEYLIHVFASTPCEANSRLMHSNSTRGGSYRNTEQPGHPPLPVHPNKDISNMEKGYTTQAKHDLAVMHDKLENRVFNDLRMEALEFHFTFSGENPVGSLYHKACMQFFHVTCT